MGTDLAIKMVLLAKANNQRLAKPDSVVWDAVVPCYPHRRIVDRSETFH